MGGTQCQDQRQQMDYKSDTVDTTRMDKTVYETEYRMEEYLHPPPMTTQRPGLWRLSREWFQHNHVNTLGKTRTSNKKKLG